LIYSDISQNKIFKNSNTLPPGKYIFKVKAANNDGVWNEKGTSFSFIKSPHYYQTIWFYLFVLLTVLFLYGFRIKKIKKRQIKLEKLNKKLQDLDNIKDQFLANTSHELKTPLNGIIGIAESLVNGVAGNLNTDAKYNLNTIIHSGKRLNSLINDILDASRLRNKTITIDKKAVSMKFLTDAAINLLYPLCRGKNLKIKNLISDTLIAAYGDENRLAQVMFNLIGNAVKFTEKGSITISGEKTGDFVQITVTDTGAGIPKDKHKEIFKSFEQVDASTERQYGGTGLGLSITKQLVELHQGTIDIESEIGKGSKFIFKIPSTDEKPVNCENNEEIISKIQDESAIYENLTPDSTIAIDEIPTILIVDDEPINQQVLKNNLSTNEYKIIQAYSGDEALEQIANNKPDLMLLDVMMPGMSGYEVSKKVRKKYSAADLPIIMVTAKNQVTDLVEGFNSGINDYLPKPFSTKELIARINTHIKLSISIVDKKELLENTISEHMKEIHEMKQVIEDYEDKYGESRLDDKTMDLINKQLMDLIKVNKIHKQENISLVIVAKKLHINAKELSQAINRKTGYNFNTFINFHRIEEMKLLLSDPNQKDKSILQIAYEVGFNSKGSFYPLFKKLTGMTPLAYRKKNY